MTSAVKKSAAAVLFVGSVCCLAYFVANSKQTLDQLRFSKNVAEFRQKVVNTPSTLVKTKETNELLVQRTSEKRIRVLCWVKTNPTNLPTKAQTIKATWGRRCDITLYMSSKADADLPAIGLNTSEGRDVLTDKAMRAFHYVYEHHINDADWFLATDDDTYVVVDNLRHFLSDKDPSVPIYYGHHFHVIVKQGYSSGGSGYVLSKEALRRLGKFGYDPKLKCELVRGADDAEIGKCLERLNVVLGDSRDSEGRSRFHCFDPGTHVVGAYPDWYLKYDAFGAKSDYLSDYAISFHYISPDQMRTLDYLIYHLRPYASLKDNTLHALATHTTSLRRHKDKFALHSDDAG